jgi:anti-sigma factor RsiW
MKKPSKNSAELLTNFDGTLSPEEQKFGELLLRYLDGTLSPEELGTFEKQLREDPKRMTEFAETLVMDVQLRDIMKEKKRKIRRVKPGGKSS